jgi:hypothetical protein
LLIERGADPDAICESYGGGHGATTMYLHVSSAGPAAAGTQVPLVEALCRAGAGVNGIDDDGLPLWTAISFEYTDAAEALARCGARVDNLCLAAALGDLDAVKSYFDGADVAPAERMGANGPALQPDLLVEYALIWAAAHGRRPVVEFLLAKDPDLRVREPCFHSTALGGARYHGQDEIVALLEPLTPPAWLQGKRLRSLSGTCRSELGVHQQPAHLHREVAGRMVGIGVDFPPGTGQAVPICPAPLTHRRVSVPDLRDGTGVDGGCDEPARQD